MQYRLVGFKTRYYAGVTDIDGMPFIRRKAQQKISELWHHFHNSMEYKIEGQVQPPSYIALEWYGDDYRKKLSYTYLAMTQVEYLKDDYDDVVYKVLPEGIYAVFPVYYREFRPHRLRVFEYLMAAGVKFDEEFDYVQFIPGQDYSSPDGIVQICIRLLEQ